jgi:hypothetical protein
VQRTLRVVLDRGFATLSVERVVYNPGASAKAVFSSEQSRPPQQSALLSWIEPQYLGLEAFPVEPKATLALGYTLKLPMRYSASA